MRALRPGDPAEIGGYQLRARLGPGGMGMVYLASTPGGRLVAVKSIRSELAEDEEFQERFRLEVRAARRVRGLYTAELLDADADAFPPWLVTAYVPGPSLAQAVKEQGPVPPGLVPLLLAGVAEALLEIHAAGIVHRDLKSPNVLLSQDGPRVIDFGIAKALDGVRLTGTGVTMGSPECMTPEQVGGMPVTPASDIFSLGSLGAFAATGRLPFDAPNSAAMMHRVLHEAPVLDGIPAGLRELLESCLAKEPDDRPTPAQVLDRCRALMPHLPAVFPQSWGPDAGNGPPGLADAGHLPLMGHVASASGRVPPSFDGSSQLPGVLVDSPGSGWAAGDPPTARWDQEIAAVATPPEAVPPAAESQPTPARPRPPAAAWLMVVAAALAVAALGVGLAMLPSLRIAIGHQHPGVTAAAVTAAVKLAATVSCVRALTTAGAWLWAARDTAGGRRGARAAACVALAVATLGLASSYTLGLAGTPAQALALAGWLAGLAAVALLRPRRRNAKRMPG